MSIVQEELAVATEEPRISVEDDANEVLATRDRLLSTVWDLSDVDGDGVLNASEFKRLVLALRDDIEESSIDTTFENFNDDLTKLEVDEADEGLADEAEQHAGDCRKGLDFDFFVEFMCASEEGLQVGCPELIEAISTLEVTPTAAAADAAPQPTSYTLASKRDAISPTNAGGSKTRHISLQNALTLRPVCAATGEDGPRDESLNVFDAFPRRMCKLFAPRQGPLRVGVPFTFCMTSARELREVVVLADDSLPIVASVKAMRDGGGHVFFRTLTVEKECHRLVFYELSREYCEESMERLFAIAAAPSTQDGSPK